MTSCGYLFIDQLRGEAVGGVEGGANKMALRA